MKNLILAAILFLPATAQAQSELLPDYAYDALAEVSIITTAGQTCDGAKINDRRLQKAMVDLMGQLVADGLDPVASVQSLESETGKGQLAIRETELRARHGVAPEGADALCDAIRAEVKTNKAMAKILKIP